jgi:hypothetical protein
MTRRLVFASRGARGTVACAIVLLLSAAGPVFADDCAHQLAAAKLRRTHGRVMTTAGLVGSLYGFVALSTTIGGHCAQVGNCSSSARNIGLGAVIGGLTLAGFGFEKAHHGDAGRELAALTARGPSSGAPIVLPTGSHQSIGLSMGPDSGSMTWRITW